MSGLAYSLKIGKSQLVVSGTVSTRALQSHFCPEMAQAGL